MHPDFAVHYARYVGFRRQRMLMAGLAVVTIIMFALAALDGLSVWLVLSLGVAALLCVAGVISAGQGLITEQAWIAAAEGIDSAEVPRLGRRTGTD